MPFFIGYEFRSLSIVDALLPDDASFSLEGKNYERFLGRRLVYRHTTEQSVVRRGKTALDVSGTVVEDDQFGEFISKEVFPRQIGCVFGKIR